MAHRLFKTTASLALLFAALASVDALGLPVQGPYYIIENESYTVCYDGRQRCPAWVYERLTCDNLVGLASRTDCRFRQDVGLPEHVRSTPRDYKDSGYDRGHLASAGNHLDSQAAMAETFLLSNVAAQDPSLNRGRWAELDRKLRDIVAVSRVVHVITGSLFLASPSTERMREVVYRVIGPNDVAVPTHFFRVIIAEGQSDEYEEHAFIIPNRPLNKDESLDQFSAAVERVERLAGISITVLQYP